MAIHPRSWPTWRPLLPLWHPTGPDGWGPPTAPAWLQTDLQARGGRMSAVTLHEPKRPHSRRETRMVWVLADPDLNAYAGSAGEVGQPWPQFAQACRVE